MKPTYDELESQLYQTRAELTQTRELLKKAFVEIDRLVSEVTKLKEKIDKNSKNSSKPPSTDHKGNTDPDQPKKKRKGRKGKIRTPYPPERINHHIECALDNCPHCGSAAIHLNGQSSEILQQVELPQVEAIVTEYQLRKYSCLSCRKNSIATLPLGVPDSAFGPKLMGLMVTLTGVFHLAKREAVQLVKELFGIDVGIGSVPNIEERVSQALDPVYHRIHSFVMESKLCKHFDETGWRDSGKRHYVWLASCEHASVYMIDRHRSAEAFHKLFNVDPDNIAAVTDRYAVYSIFKVHQYCLAHLIREFRSYAERDGPDKELGSALENELKTACHHHKEYREGNTTLAIRNRSLGRRKKKMEFYLEDAMANGSDDLSRLSENLLDDFDKLWTFSKISGMEPTNNLAERDLRKLVIWRRKSYGTRSERGKRFVERITTVAQTLKRQSRSILAFIEEAIQSFYAKTFTPFISESMGF
jgi:transposase